MSIDRFDGSKMINTHCHEILQPYQDMHGAQMHLSSSTINKSVLVLVHMLCLFLIACSLVVQLQNVVYTGSVSVFFSRPCHAYRIKKKCNATVRTGCIWIHISLALQIHNHNLENIFTHKIQFLLFYEYNYSGWSICWSLTADKMWVTYTEQGA